MDEKNLLSEFADRFVNKQFRERFVHEAMKTPRDLHGRICHDIEKVFDRKFRGKVAPFKDADECLFLGWSSSIATTTWQEAKSRMATGGGGYLVIKSDGKAFYAETEDYPAVPYAGSS